MTEADKPAFVAALTELAMLKGQRLTGEQFAAWWNAMRHNWQLEEFKNASARLSQDCEYMPNPYHFAQLRRAASEQTSAEAWTRVLTAIRHLSPRESTNIDPQTDRVVRAMGGYGHLAGTNSDQMPWRAKRFAELWQELGQADEARAVLPHLAPVSRLTGPRSVGDLLKAGGQ